LLHRILALTKDPKDSRDTKDAGPCFRLSPCSPWKLPAKSILGGATNIHLATSSVTPDRSALNGHLGHCWNVGRFGCRAGPAPSQSPKGAAMILLNPKHHTREYPDERSRAIMLKTIDFFERKGKRRLTHDDRERVWYADFLEFVKQERIFATLLTPAGYGDSDARWDTWRICEFNEILAFYGLAYWYTWQVSILGLGPIW